MITLKKYSKDLQSEWDSFVAKAKNSHFMFFRNYMDYHSDTFNDHSLLFYFDNKLIALLPANFVGTTLFSHQGLTFGGLVLSKSIKAQKVIEVFASLTTYLNGNGFTTLIYKCVPYIYSAIPAEEALYALFLQNAKLIRRELSSCIDLSNKLVYSDSRKNTIKKAKQSNFTLSESSDLRAYWNIVEEVLKFQHNAKPVHSYLEIQGLRDSFPDNIRLFIVRDESNKLMAGTLLYITATVVHTQYLASTIIGKKLGALDLLLDYLINDLFKEYKFFDLGTSNENNGREINEGLIFQKEGFGARGVVHDCYEVVV